jgi:hypothetical protein
LQTGDEFELTLLPALKAWLQHYDHGMQAAITLLHESLNPGHHEEMVKYSTVHHLHSIYSNFWSTTSQGNLDATVFLTDGKK